MFRGRVRKRAIQQNKNLLVENTQDLEKRVRFAIFSKEETQDLEKYIHSIAPNAQITLVKE